MAIDKSIRQYYQDGKKVDPITKVTSEIVKKWLPKTGEKLISSYIPTKKDPIPKGVKRKLQQKALSKLGIGGLNPILGILSLFGIDPFTWFSEKLTKGGVEQAFTSGMAGFGASPKGRELRELEKRRDYMLRRKAENKSYSKKNLEEVTNQINEIKKTKNVMEEVTADDPFAWSETTGGDEVSVGYEEGQVDPNLARHIPKDSPISQFPGENEIVQQQRAKKEASDAMVAKEIAAAEAFRIDQEKQQRLKEQAAAYAAEQAAQAAVLPPQLGGDRGGQAQPSPGGGGGQPQTGGGGYERGDYGGRGYHWKKGGRVDKALGGRSRDI
jgi:hypothetical protein